ncbi:cytochrome b [Derxia lacustris]|uniref:cytochrome b n=1 Tax=Derxia lacustris TaxID=764842 RepID=UPI0015939F8C|nr:cytochrome b/b6 domain-containing protein [Derxia lacustris]
MAELPTQDVRHPAAVRWLHWATLALVLAAFALVLARELFDGGPWRALLMQVHRLAGVAVIGLALARIGVRQRVELASTGVTALPMRLAAGAVHLALYGLLIGLPLLGWALTSARGQPVALPFGLLLPPLIERDLDLADTLEFWHEAAAWTLAALVGLHAAAAVFHHRVLGDATLVAMLPAGRSRS